MLTLYGVPKSRSLRVSWMLAHTLAWANGWSLPLSDALRDYLSRCTQRPAFREAASRERSG